MLSVRKSVCSVGRRPAGCCQRAARLMQLPARAIGIATAVVLVGVGADLAYHGQHVWGWAALCSAGLLFFLETAWVVTLFLQLRRRHSSSSTLLVPASGCAASSAGVHHQLPQQEPVVPPCWALVLRFSGWRKALLYAALGCFFLARPQRHIRLWLCSGAGALLLFLAATHLHMGLCLPAPAPLPHLLLRPHDGRRLGSLRRTDEDDDSPEEEEERSEAAADIEEEASSAGLLVDDELPEPIAGAAEVVRDGGRTASVPPPSYDSLFVQDTILQV